MEVIIINKKARTMKLISILLSLGTAITINDAQDELLWEIDTNHDGKISYNESIDAGHNKEHLLVNGYRGGS